MSFYFGLTQKTEWQLLAKINRQVNKESPLVNANFLYLSSTVLVTPSSISEGGTSIRILSLFTIF